MLSIQCVQYLNLNNSFNILNSLNSKKNIFIESTTKKA